METLPTELLAQIFESLSDDDILNLPSHIISHTLTEAQAQTMFRTMSVWLEKSSLERLVRVSRNSNLARHVREVRFYDDGLSDICDWDYREPPFEQKSDDCKVGVNYSKYKIHLRNQTRMKERQEDVLLLNIAFELLFNLETVSIANKREDGLMNTTDDLWRYGLDKNIYNQWGSHLMEVLLRVMSMRTNKVPSFKVLYGAQPDYLARGLKAINFPALLTKLSPNTVVSAMQSLRFPKLKSVRYGKDEIFFDTAVREEAFGHYSDESADFGTTAAIAKMLSSAPLLERLSLKLCGEYEGSVDKKSGLLGIPYLPLDSMRGSNKLQHLKRLSLANFAIGEDQFVQFLLTVAGHLNRLHLEDIIIDRGSWASAFSRLEGQFKQLRFLKVNYYDSLYEAGLGHDGLTRADFGRVVPTSIVS